MARAKYPEGTVFLVPLRNGGFARGVVARVNPRAACIFGYFFGPKLEKIGVIKLSDLSSGSAIASMRFGDLGIVNGEWQVVDSIRHWDRENWKMPDFMRRDPIGRRAWLVRYSDSDPAKIEGEAPIAFDANLPENWSWGYGAVELFLTEALG